MKEIGGYLELERLSGQEYHEHMIKLNLGRTALLYLLKAAGTHTLWVPHFLCESVTDACLRAGYELKYYRIGRNFLPEDGVRPAPGEYLYLVNFYGQLSNAQILASFGQYDRRVIVDNTHAFFQRPVHGVPTLYSLRKFFGLSDGAYVYMGNLAPALPVSLLEQDLSHTRMGHILGRYETEASAHYQTMLDNAHAFDHETVKQMSALTDNLLHGIDYAKARRVREDNYQALDSLLGAENPLTLRTPEGPFTYPFYHKNGITLRKKMAQYKIYVPTYWSNVLKDMSETSLEYDYAANILPLPCDQRYTAEDMRRVADVLHQCAAEAEETA